MAGPANVLWGWLGLDLLPLKASFTVVCFKRPCFSPIMTKVLECGGTALAQRSAKLISSAALVTSTSESSDSTSAFMAFESACDTFGDLSLGPRGGVGGGGGTPSGNFGGGGGTEPVRAFMLLPSGLGGAREALDEDFSAGLPELRLLPRLRLRLFSLPPLDRDRLEDLTRCGTREAERLAFASGLWRFRAGWSSQTSFFSEPSLRRSRRCCLSISLRCLSASSLS